MSVLRLVQLHALSVGAFASLLLVARAPSQDAPAPLPGRDRVQVEALEQAAAASSDDPATWLALADAHARASRWGVAAATLAHGRRLVPNDAPLAHAHAGALAALGHLHLALGAAEDAVWSCKRGPCEPSLAADVDHRARVLRELVAGMATAERGPEGQRLVRALRVKSDALVR